MRARKTIERGMLPSELRELRLRAGLSQDKLARMLGVKSSTISRWERGNRTIPVPVAIAVRYLLGVRSAKKLGVSLTGKQLEVSPEGTPRGECQAASPISERH